MLEEYQEEGSSPGVFESQLLFSVKKQYYNFKSDGIMLGHILFMTRDSVVINGEKVITDWNRLIDNDIAGEWSLLYKSSSKKNVLYFNARGKFGDSKYVDFIGVNDSVLEIQSPLIISKIIRMHRINDQ